MKISLRIISWSVLFLGCVESKVPTRSWNCNSGPLLSFLCKLLRIRTPSKPPLSPIASPIRAPRPATTSTPTVTAPSLLTTFYAIGDVPYNASQAITLQTQMLELPADAEFVVHVGDLRRAGKNISCVRSEYTDAANFLRRSRVPVFVILGDNDWTDCPNRTEGLKFWQDEFLQFESRYWTHDFNIQRQTGRPDNFAFISKESLFIGLNIIGGDVHDVTEWTTRLSDQVKWTIERINTYQLARPASHVGRVVIFGHANPNTRHDNFFQPLRAYIRDTLQNKLPVLYINGDKHEWLYEPNYFAQASWLRIMVSGLAKDPPLKVVVKADGKFLPPQEAFAIDRSL